MGKSLILTTNTSSAQVTPGNAVPLGNITRRFGCGYILGNNAIVITQPGYYNIDVLTTFTGTVGNVVLDVQQNGATIPAATATETLSAANTQSKTITIPTTARVYNESYSPITVVVDTASTSTPTVSAISVRIVKE